MFAFGGVYPATLVVPAIICIVLALAYRPALVGSSPTRSRRSLVGDRGRDDAAADDPAAARPPARDRSRRRSRSPGRCFSRRSEADRCPSRSIYASDRGRHCCCFASLLLLLLPPLATSWRAAACAPITRLIAVIGLVLSAIAIAQSATGRGLMYGIGSPASDGPDRSVRS